MYYRDPRKVSDGNGRISGVVLVSGWSQGRTPTVLNRPGPFVIVIVEFQVI